MQKSTEEKMGSPPSSIRMQSINGNTPLVRKKGVRTARDMEFSSFVAEIYSNN